MNNPGMMPAVFSMNGSDKHPAPMAEETNVKTAAPVDPSLNKEELLCDRPTAFSQMGSNISKSK